MTPRRASRLPPADARRLLRQRTGRAQAVLAGRGAAALCATLQALGLRDSHILIPANTCYVVLWAVIQSGNMPVLVDVDLLTANISPETLASATTDKAAAVIPAHMYGLPAPMADITAWANERGIVVIEDAALAMGVTADGQPAGSWGDVSILSFGRGKGVEMDNGGAALTNDASLAHEVERALTRLSLWNDALDRLNREWLDIYWALHQHEADNPRLSTLYPRFFELYGDITRYRLSDTAWRDFPAAVDALDSGIAHRAALAELYDDRLRESPTRTLARPDGSILWRYPLLVPANQRDMVLHTLWAAGVHEATRWYPSLQPMHSALAPTVAMTSTPHANRLGNETINLPLSSETSEAAAMQIADVVLHTFNSR